jgi:hypothetical protein
MSTLTETSLADMKVGFPPAPKPIQGIPNLQSLIDLLFDMCRCSQMHRSPASANINLLFCAAPKDVYAFPDKEAYPTAFAPFPPMVSDIPNFSTCNDEIKRATARATHALAKKTQADIIAMNIALTDIFLECLSSQVRASFQQQHLCKPNLIFIDMFLWFVNHYGKTTSEDRKANRQCMAVDWHPSNGFDHLPLCLFTSAAFTSRAGYLMNDIDVVDIGLRVIKSCSMYTKDYKQWIAHEAIRPCINKDMNSFKEFWSSKIALVNQTAIPASLHGYGMAVVNNNDGSVISYGESITNFGAAYTATQESVKMQGSMIALLQSQFNAMQQYFMALQSQPPPPIYAQQFQLCAPNNRRGLLCRTGSGRGRGYQNPGYQQPTGVPPMRAPTPYKQFKNWHYCHTHGGDVNNTHMSATCAKSSPLHSWQAYHTNMMGGSTAGMHKTILLPATSCAPPIACASQIQRPPTPVAWQSPPPPVNFTQSMAAMHPLVLYQAIYHMGQQPSNVAPPLPPLSGAMMHYYAPFPQQPVYQHPPPF